MFGNRSDDAFNALATRVQTLEDTFSMALPRIGGLEGQIPVMQKQLSSFEARLDRELQRRRFHDDGDGHLGNKISLLQP